MNYAIIVVPPPVTNTVHSIAYLFLLIALTKLWLC
jgi:hypothetical protein